MPEHFGTFKRELMNYSGVIRRGLGGGRGTSSRNSTMLVEFAGERGLGEKGKEIQVLATRTEPELLRKRGTVGR